MSERDGGPAFPLAAVMPTATFDGQTWWHTQHIPANPGMTLRDYFAAAAVQGMMARVGAHDAYIVAHDAYILADAMLAERAKERK